jgi:hypothetical protein
VGNAGSDGSSFLATTRDRLAGGTMTEEIKRLQWIVHKGVTIAHTDFRGLKGQSLIDQIDKNLGELLDKVKGGKRNLLLMTDITDVPMTGDSYTKIRQVSEVLAPYVVARALLGVAGSRRVVLKAINAVVDYSVKAFSAKEEAMEWLVERYMSR